MKQKEGQIDPYSRENFAEAEELVKKLAGLKFKIKYRPSSAKSKPNLEPEISFQKTVLGRLLPRAGCLFSVIYNRDLATRMFGLKHKHKALPDLSKTKGFFTSPHRVMNVDELGEIANVFEDLRLKLCQKEKDGEEVATQSQ